MTQGEGLKKEKKEELILHASSEAGDHQSEKIRWGGPNHGR